MGRLSQSANIMKDRRGSAVLLLGLLFFFIIFIFGMYLMEYRILLAQKDKINDALVGAELAALGTVDREKLGYWIFELPENEARTVFEAYFFENLQDVCVGLPVVNEFIVFNHDDVPSVCPSGNIIEEPAVHAVITVTVKRPVLRGLLGDTVEFTLHKDSDDIFD